VDVPSQALLQHIFLKESRSLLQYVSEADPWTARKEHRTLELVLELARQEQRALAKIVRCLLKHHIMPSNPIAYPSNFTTINMVSLEHLFPYLIDSQEKCIKELEHRLPGVADVQARSLANEYLEMKRQHLKLLTEAARSGTAPPTLAAAHS
jgi:hypothetical protein